jgi:adenylosuccinate lyase
MPREIYAPIAQALCQIVLTLDKIALDIRLGARSGRPIYQEPFGKKQKGSSAMPHKKNTISTEQMEGMGRMAKGFENMIKENIKTWEERAIEQSCVERVAWPDLFHVVIHSLKTMTRVLKGLVVYPDNMLWEIIESRGCYASSEAKEVLRKLGVQYGLTTEDAYRIIQLAAFNAFEPSDAIKRIRTNLPNSLTEADEALKDMAWYHEPKPTSIRWIISEGYLKTSPQLDITEGEVQKWNVILKQIFSQADNLEKWNQIFQPSYLLKNEAKLYQEIIGA